MKTQEYLQQAIRFERMAKNKLQEIERYRDMVASVTVAPKTDVIQSSGDKDKLGSMVAKIIDLEAEIENIIDVRERIIRQIESMKNPDIYQVLYGKYINGESLNEVGRLIHCSKTQIYRLHDRAIEDFEKKYGKYYLDVS